MAGNTIEDLYGWRMAEVHILGLGDPTSGCKTGVTQHKRSSGPSGLPASLPSTALRGETIWYRLLGVGTIDYRHRIDCLTVIGLVLLASAVTVQRQFVGSKADSLQHQALCLCIRTGIPFV